MTHSRVSNERRPAGNRSQKAEAGRHRASRLRATAALLVGFLALAGRGEAAAADEPGRVTGIGGVFFKAKDPKVLAAWYRDMLGLPLQPWGGAALRYDAPDHPPVVTWSAFPATTKYFAPSTGELMIDYAVDDLDALLARLHAKGIEPLGQTDDTSGRFAWILDPEGNKVELWQPRRATP